MNKRFFYIFSLSIAFITFAKISIAFPEEENGVITKNFTAEKGGSLIVSLSEGDVEINAWDKNEVFIKVTGDNDDDELDDIKVTQNGNTFREIGRAHV